MNRAGLIDSLWILAGMTVALSLALMVIHAEHGLALTSIGSTVVLLFCFPQHEGAQPRAVLISHLLGALIGFGLLHSVGAHPWSMALGVASIAVVMKLANIMHPPAGANPLIVLNIKAGWMFLLDPLLLALAVVMAVVWLWSRLRPGSSPGSPQGSRWPLRYW